MTKIRHVPLARAARTLGTTVGVLSELHTQGNLPEAVQVNGIWTVPFESLPGIAHRQNFILDISQELYRPPPPNVANNGSLANAHITQPVPTIASPDQATELADQLAGIHHRIDAANQLHLKTAQLLEELATTVRRLQTKEDEWETMLDDLENQLDAERHRNDELVNAYQQLQVENESW